MAMVVRPFEAASRASWTTRSEVESSAEVASSRRLGRGVDVSDMDGMGEWGWDG